MTHPIQFALGLLIVLVVLADVFGSILVPRPTPRGVRVGPWLVRAVTPLWRRIAVRLPSRRLRQDFRGSLGPALLVMALGAWVLLLTLGFALLLHADPDNVSLDDFGFGEALFQAALALSTLGTLNADIDGPGRLIVASAGIVGFSVLSLTIAFLLAIQSALHRRETLVLTLAARAGRPPTAVSLLTAMAGCDDAELAELFAAWERWTADVTQSHLSYPVLLRFRSLDEDAEWLPCLAAVADAAAVVAAAAPDSYPRAARSAGFLVATVDRMISEFARMLRLPRDSRLGLDPAIDRLADRIGTLGFPPVDAQAFEDRLRRREATRFASLPALAAALDLAWTDPRGADL